MNTLTSPCTGGSPARADRHDVPAAAEHRGEVSQRPQQEGLSHRRPSVGESRSSVVAGGNRDSCLSKCTGLNLNGNVLVISDLCLRYKSYGYKESGYADKNITIYDLVTTKV